MVKHSKEGIKENRNQLFLGIVSIQLQKCYNFTKNNVLQSATASTLKLYFSLVWLA